MSKSKNNHGEILTKTIAKRTRYPWGVWADGKHRRLTRGVHFFVAPENFTTAVYNHCTRFNATTKDKTRLEGHCVIEDKDHVRIQITLSTTK